MEIADLGSLCDLASKILTSVPGTRYRSSSDVLRRFHNGVLVLESKNSQWRTQLRRFGMSEDPNLRPLLERASQMLNYEINHVKKMEQSRLMRFTKRIFPEELVEILDDIAKMVDSGPQLVADKIRHNKLLETLNSDTPPPFPFETDRLYVPLPEQVTKLQSVLEAADGPRIVNVYGPKGLGKSGIAKYVALQYEAGSDNTQHFPDGVYYLDCREAVCNEVGPLQMELLENLGFKAGLGDFELDSQWAAVGGRRALRPPLKYANSHVLELRLRLANLKVLILLDNVPEGDFLKHFVVRTQGKYLVTSEMKATCLDAERIEIQWPNKQEARQILANYTEGLPIKGKFPDHLQAVVDGIIEKLRCHPQSLVTVGKTIDRGRATDVTVWEHIKQQLREPKI